MPCNTRRVLELEEEKKRKAKAKKRKEKEKARKEQEAKEARERVEASRTAIRNQAKKLGWKLTETNLNEFVASKAYGYNSDKIKFKISPRGIIETVTDKISMPNHANAEAFLRNIGTILKGTWKVFQRYPGKEAHAHANTHRHSHEH